MELIQLHEDFLLVRLNEIFKHGLLLETCRFRCFGILQILFRARHEFVVGLRRAKRHLFQQ